MSYITKTFYAPDTLAPPTPSGLVAQGGERSISLSCGSVVDAVSPEWMVQSALAGYKWYVSTTLSGAYSFLAQTVSPSYTHTGLTYATTRYYKVSAIDSAGNESAQSAVASATTRENVAPSLVGPTATSLSATGGTIQFVATDANNDTITYSLTTTRNGITIDSSSGLVTVTAAAAGTSGNIVVQASDGSLTSSVTCNVTVTTNVQQIKWNPGHYMQDRTYVQADRFAHYDLAEFKDNSEIKGASVFFRWKDLEGDTRGSYSTSAVIAELNKLKTLSLTTGKRKMLMLRCMDRAYDYSTYTAFLPAYLNTAGKVFNASTLGVGYNDWHWYRWDATTVGWYLDMWTALAAAIQSAGLMEYVEAVCPHQESSIPGSGTLFSASALDTQYRRIASTLKTLFPTCQVWYPMNWEPYSPMPALIQHFAESAVAVGNPDTQYTGTMYADQIIRGAVGSFDSRGKTGIIFGCEDTSLGYRNTTTGWDGSAVQYFNYLNGTMRATHVCWDRQNYTGRADQQWNGTNGVLWMINNYPLTTTALPSDYGRVGAILWRGDFDTSNPDSSVGNFRQWHGPDYPDIPYYWGVPSYGRPPQISGDNTSGAVGSSYFGDGSLLSLVSSPTRTGARTARVRVLNRNLPQDIEGTFAGARRTELVGDETMDRAAYRYLPSNVDRWIAFSVYIDPSWAEVYDSWLNIVQIGPGYASGTGAPSPDVAIMADGGKWRVVHRWDTNGYAQQVPWYQQFTYTHDMSNTEDIAVKHCPNVAATKAALADFTKGTWHDFIVQAKFDWRNSAAGGQGFFRLWKRTGSGAWVQLLNIVPGPVTYGGYTTDIGIGYDQSQVVNQQSGHVLKMGLYGAEGNFYNPFYADQYLKTIYLDNIKIGNESVTFAQMEPEGAAPSATSVIKWNPGFYFALSPSGGMRDGAAQRAADWAWMQANSGSHIKGYVIAKALREWEMDQAAPFYDYTRIENGVQYGGFAMIDWYLDKCRQLGKQLMLTLNDKGWGDSSYDIPWNNYWVSQSGWTLPYSATPDPNDYMNRIVLENSGAIARLNQIIAAYGTRYNNDPNLQMFGLSESSASAITSSSVAEAYKTGWKSWLTAATQAFPNTIIRSGQNFVYGPTWEKDLLAWVKQRNDSGLGCIAVGGPDHEYGLTNIASPSNQIDANRMWRGATMTDAVIGGSVTGADYRAIYPWVGETQERGYTNPSYPMDTAQQIWDYQKTTMKASYVIFNNYSDPVSINTVAAANGGIVNDFVPATLQGRVGPNLSTRFASNVNFSQVASYTNGLEFAHTGTDSATGFAFSSTQPQIWGGYNVSKPSSATWQMICGPTSDVLGEVFEYSFVDGITGPTGVAQRALQVRRKRAYSAPDQASYQLYPNTSLAQGMFYIRGVVKFPPNFLSTLSANGGWFVGLAEAKTSSERRVNLALVNWNSLGWRLYLSAEDTSGGNVLWAIESAANSISLVNDCLTYELAARYSNGADGWAWAALNGSSTVAGTSFQRAGANMPAGTHTINRIFPWIYYHNGNANTALNRWFLSAEVWDRWPADASSHPSWI